MWSAVRVQDQIRSGLDGIDWMSVQEIRRMELIVLVLVELMMHYFV